MSYARTCLTYARYISINNLLRQGFSPRLQKFILAFGGTVARICFDVIRHQNRRALEVSKILVRHDFVERKALLHRLIVQRLPLPERLQRILVFSLLL